MRKLEYRKGLHVRQKVQPDFSGRNPYPRREGITVSDQLVEHRSSARADYAEVQWNGFEHTEFVHYASLDIIEEVANAS